MSNKSADHLQQVSGMNLMFFFPRNEEGKIDVKRGVYETNNQPKKSNFKYEQEGRLYIGVAKVEIKDVTITGERCLMFEYTGNKIGTIDAYKKEIRN